MNNQTTPWVSLGPSTAASKKKNPIIIWSAEMSAISLARDRLSDWADLRSFKQYMFKCISKQFIRNI